MDPDLIVEVRRGRNDPELFVYALEARAAAVHGAVEVPLQEQDAFLALRQRRRRVFGPRRRRRLGRFQALGGLVEVGGESLQGGARMLLEGPLRRRQPVRSLQANPTKQKRRDKCKMEANGYDDAKEMVRPSEPALRKKARRRALLFVAAFLWPLDSFFWL